MVEKPQIEANAVWKQRYRASGLWEVELARRALSRGITLSAVSGTGQIYAWDVLSGVQHRLTDSQEGIFTGSLAPDGCYIYYLRDEAGSEIGHYVRIPWDGGAEQDLTPDMPPYAALYRCAVSAGGTMFAFTPTEASGFPLYCVDLYSDGTAGAPRELYRSPKLIDDAALSTGAELAVVATTEHAQARQYSLLAFDTADGRLVAALSDLPQGSIRAVMFSPLPSDPRLLCMADRSGYNRPLIWNAVNGERIDLPVGDLAGDVEPLDWSLDGRQLLLKQSAFAAQRLYVYDLERATLLPLAHQGGTYRNAQFGPQSQIFALWSDSTHLPQVVALDGATGAWKGTVLAAGETPPARRLTSVSFRSSDGVAIQGWLGLPDGAGPFPTILSLHGGPHMVSEEVYDLEGQTWLDHGYAYLLINYRGSTTFGRAFKEQIWGDLGHWEVEDMVAARDWLVAEGIAQPDVILLTGASYGGYLTLMALGKQPELWAGGMALFSSVDLSSEFYDGTDWTKGYLTAMMGGTPEEKAEQYAASSPITYAAQVRAPLLVIQGRNDLRCPPRQIEDYAKQMRLLGKPFEIEWFDAGHGGVETELLIAFQERLLDFAYRMKQGVKVRSNTFQITTENTKGTQA